MGTTFVFDSFDITMHSWCNSVWLMGLSHVINKSCIKFWYLLAQLKEQKVMFGTLLRRIKPLSGCICRVPINIQNGKFLLSFHSFVCLKSEMTFLLILCAHSSRRSTRLKGDIETVSVCPSFRPSFRPKRKYSHSHYFTYPYQIYTASENFYNM